ncbi:Uncharacterized protein HSRCO_1439 [Halanaeroarchaeum sp. HSR-CO]|nr:Uncharacterized protein HSRCO_1439 [Halanaeroarchaeum sp. HSR-CO]
MIAFSMDESGLLTFGTEGMIFDTTPLSLRRAVGFVRDRLDRDGLRAGVDDVSQFVFYGIATRYEGIEYDWNALSPFIGLDIWAENEGRFVSPDVAERVFDTIGLTPIPAFRKELPAREFDATAQEMPNSHWRDGAAAGIIVRNKAGGRAVLFPPDDEPSATAPTSDVATTVDDAVSCNLRTELDRLNATVDTVDVDIIADRLVDRIARVDFANLRATLDAEPDRFRQLVSASVRSEIRALRGNGVDLR